MKIENQIITDIGDQGDGLSFYGLDFHEVDHCFINLDSHPVEVLDEAVGVTWGSSASFHDCIIRGAAKLVLIGSGDLNMRPIEEGKTVTFDHCIFEHFGRRGPEVQSGMRVKMVKCLIRNWGSPDRFSVRNFAAHVHDAGSELEIRDCIFEQDNFLTRNFFTDFINHIGQNYNNTGLKGLFTGQWRFLPGTCRGAMAEMKGKLLVENCYKNHWWIRLQNSKGTMISEDYENLMDYFDKLYQSFLKFGTNIS